MAFDLLRGMAQKVRESDTRATKFATEARDAETRLQPAELAAPRESAESR